MNLVGYDSSDEDVPLESQKSVKADTRRDVNTAAPNGHAAASEPPRKGHPGNSSQPTASTPAPGPTTGPATGPASRQHLGHAQGPTAGPMPQAAEMSEDEDGDDGSSSPHSKARALIHSLTLPPIAKVAIPPSPPGSPDAATTAKIKNFLDLKAQGMHFNEKLATNSTLLNPGMMGVLFDHASIDEEASHATALPDDLQVGGPGGTSFDGWAYTESIREEIKKRQKKRGIDFVAAQNPAPARGRSGTGKGS